MAAVEIYLRSKGYQYTKLHAGTLYQFRNQEEYENPPWSWMESFDPLKDIFFVNGKRHDKNDSKEKWLFLGDSVTIGMGVARESAYPSLIQKQFSDIDVINAGVIGSGTRFQVRLYEDLLSNFKHQKVILGFNFFNDFRDYFGESNYGVLSEAKSGSAWPLKILRGVLTQSATFKYLNVIHYSHPNKFSHRLIRLISKMGHSREQSSKTNDGYNLIDFISSEYLLYVDPIRPEYDYAYQGIKNLFNRVASIAHDHNITLYIVMIPSRSMVFDKFYNTDLQGESAVHYFKERSLSFKPEALNFHLPLERVMKICRQFKEVKCLDILPEVKKIGETFFLPGNDHPSVRGHELLAQELAKKLKE